MKYCSKRERLCQKCYNVWYRWNNPDKKTEADQKYRKSEKGRARRNEYARRKLHEDPKVKEYQRKYHRERYHRIKKGPSVVEEPPVEVEEQVFTFEEAGLFLLEEDSSSES